MPSRRLPGRTDPTYADEGIDWGRTYSAVRRRSWIIVLVTIVGTGLGFLFARSMQPIYTAEARIWFEETSGTAALGPVAAGQLLETNSWEELLRSFAVLDSVVHKLDLYLRAPAADSALFRVFDVVLDEDGGAYLPGSYTLSVDDAGSQWSLLRDQTGGEVVLESGAVGDPIGRDVGLIWAPDPTELTPGREVEFGLSTIRDASRGLQAALQTSMDQAGNLMRINLARSSPDAAADIINLAMEEFLEVAARMARGSIEARGDQIADALDIAEREYEEASRALEEFQVLNSTLSAGAGGDAGGSAVAGGYYELLARRDALDRDRRTLQRVLDRAETSDRFPEETLLAVESVAMPPSIQAALSNLAELRVDRRDAQLRYADGSAPLRAIDDEIERVESVLLPSMVRDLVAEVTIQIEGLEGDALDRVGDLQSIPPRVRQQNDLIREFTQAEAKLSDLQARYDATRLAAISSMPGIQIFDRADPTRVPESQPGIFVLLFSLFGSLGAAGALVLVLDRLDRRLRYPSQITRGMGLNILGGIPRLKSGRGKARRQSETELVEAFRSLRLNLDHSYGSAGPRLVTITSPDAGDGKSFVSANLANAYARQGLRTIVIDGDTRRGTQHELFGGPRVPGLTDYLDGDVSLDALVQEQVGSNLAYIPSGHRSEQSPEQLGSRHMRELVSRLKSDYDVILIDTPPMSAGVDPLALATLTGNMLLVLRTGATDVGLAEANLEMLDQLPVRVLGAVLNDIATRDQGYRRYGYRSDYAIEAETSSGDVDARRRLIAAGR